jgi:transcriptional regulator with XRE-family HTH domain
VENPEHPHPAEDFAQTLAALKDAYRVNDTEVARTIGVHVSTVNNWAHGKANPRPAAIRALAAAYPQFTEDRLFAAIGRKAPAPLSPERREKVLEIFDQLTEEQQQMYLITGQALADSNRQ